MSNKTVIRETNKTNYVSIPIRIVNDKRLKPNSYRILTSILSDKDDFTISYQLFANRFDINVDTVRNCMKELEECGYIRRIEKARGWHYTVSEFGNLNSSGQECTTTNTTDTKKIHYTPFNIEVVEVMEKIEKLTSKEDSILLCEEFTNPNDKNEFDVKGMKTLLKKLQRDLYKKLYEPRINYLHNRAPVPKKILQQYSSYLKTEIFECENTDSNQMSNKFMYMVNDWHKSEFERKLDDETRFIDSMENPMD